MGVCKSAFIGTDAAAQHLPESQHNLRTSAASPTTRRGPRQVVGSKAAEREMDERSRDGSAKSLEPAVPAAVTWRLERTVEWVGDRREGNQVWLDYRPADDTLVAVNGVCCGVIEGDDDNAALFAVWLGDAPVSAALKNAPVGDENR